VQLDDVLDDGEPEPKPAVRPRRGRVGLPKSVEHEWEHIAADPDPGVGDRELDRTVDHP
jgi:hypothetical protein